MSIIIPNICIDDYIYVYYVLFLISLQIILKPDQTHNFDLFSTQGTSKTGAQFDIGLLGFKFTYFLKLTHEPKFNTLTWTLDYTKNSDFGKFIRLIFFF